MTVEADIGNLRRAASAGLGWHSAGNIVRRGAVSLSAMVYAALLGPDQFGVIGLTLIFIAALVVIQELGASTYIVYAQDLSPRTITTLFWFNLAVAVLAAGLVAGGAPLAADLFHEPRLTLVLKAIALSHLIMSLGVTQRAIMQKALRFQLLAKIDVAAVIAGVSAGIMVALSGGGIWGFVTQSLIVAFLSSLGYWCFAGWLPRPGSGLTGVGPAVRYSANLAAFHVLNFFGRNSDDILIGRYMTTADLGIYGVAYRVMTFPSVIIGHAVAYAMLPVLSSLRDRDREFAKFLTESAQTVAFITFPMMVGVFVVADDFVRVVFGQSWETTAVLLKILAPVGLVQSVGVLTGTVYQAKGRTDLLLKWGLYATPVFIVFILLGLKWGVVGVAAAYGIGYLIFIAYPGFWIPFRLIDLPVPRFLLSLARPLFCSLLMGACVAFLQEILLGDAAASIRLLATVAAGIVAYIAASLLFNAEKFRQIVRLQFLPPG